MANPFHCVELHGNAEPLRKGPGQENALVELPLPEAPGMEGDGQDALEGFPREDPVIVIRHVEAQGPGHGRLSAEFHAQDRFTQISGIDSDGAYSERGRPLRIPRYAGGAKGPFRFRPGAGKGIAATGADRFPDRLEPLDTQRTEGRPFFEDDGAAKWTGTGKQGGQEFFDKLLHAIRHLRKGPLGKVDHLG
jgi:hypothetical protein